jgi:SAM-dependent methyltransferase
MKFQLSGEDPMTMRIQPQIDEFRKYFTGTVLDAGCYTGYLYHALGKPHGYVGYDIWPEAIKVAREFAPEAIFITADLRTCRLATYDYVWCSQTIEEGGCPPSVIDRLRAAARIACIFVQSDKMLELNDKPFQARPDET